jgi:hypothetical protein
MSEPVKWAFEGIGATVVGVVLALVLPKVWRWWRPRRVPQPAPTQVSAKAGDRGVAIGGSVTDSSIVTGDQSSPPSDTER